MIERVHRVDVVGFSTSEKRADNTMSITVYDNNFKQYKFTTTGKMLLKDIIKMIAREMSK